MPGHLAHLSKITLGEQKNILRLIKELLTATDEGENPHGLGITDAKVQLPVNEDWHVYVEIPSMSPAQFMAAIERYGLLSPEQVQAAADAIGLNWNENDRTRELYGTLPLASSWKNVYRLDVDAKEGVKTL